MKTKSYLPFIMTGTAGSYVDYMNSKVSCKKYLDEVFFISSFS